MYKLDVRDHKRWGINISRAGGSGIIKRGRSGDTGSCMGRHVRCGDDQSRLNLKRSPKKAGAFKKEVTPPVKTTVKGGVLTNKTSTLIHTRDMDVPYKIKLYDRRGRPEGLPPV